MNDDYWGISTHIDIYGCCPEKIRSKEDIKKYINAICALIDMKKYGDCIVEHFGENEEVKGYTFIQMIETSLISGHLVELTNDVHIDIFSCKVYDTKKAANFTKKYFDGIIMKYKSLKR